MRTITHLYRHGTIELDCELEFSPGRRATLTDPPDPAEAYLISAKVGEVDILPLLSEGLIQDIEKAAVWEQS